MTNDATAPAQPAPLLGLGSSGGLGPVACATCGERTYYTRAHIDAAVASERERCAKLCEEVHADTSECPELALHCAARIRGA